MNGDEASKIVDVEDMHTRLDELLSMVASGMELIVVDGETPVARVTPMTVSNKPRVPGLHPGAMVTSDDFDDPLTDDFWINEL